MKRFMKELEEITEDNFSLTSSVCSPRDFPQTSRSMTLFCSFFAIVLTPLIRPIVALV